MPTTKRARNIIADKVLADAQRCQAKYDRDAACVSQALRTRRIAFDDIDDDPLSVMAFAKQVLRSSLAAVTSNGEIIAPPPNVGRIFSIDTLDEDIVLRHFSFAVGKKDIPCPKCSALMFMDECINAKDVIKKGKSPEFMMCCSNGAVHVPQSPRISQEFMDTVLNHAGNHLPVLNAKVAFAGVNSYKAECPGKQYGFKILGPYDRIICTNLMASPTFAGIYIYDADEQIRMRNAMQCKLPVDEIISLPILSLVTRYLMDNNPYAVTLRLAAAHQHQPVTLLSSVMYHMKSPLSQGGEVAALFPMDGISRSHFAVTTLKGNRIQDCDPIVLHFDEPSIQSPTQRIDYDHASYDALRFPILFPTGVYGWNRSFQSVGRDRRVSMREYYSYMLQDRPYENNLLMQGKRLLQEYIVDAAAKIEDSEMKFQASHQKELRADSYDKIKRAQQEGYTGTLGRSFSKPQVLSKSIRSSPAQKAAKYKDFVAAFRYHGGVDAFVTITANPNWPEVLSALKPGFTPQDRVDIIDRVFKIKLKKAIAAINEGMLGDQVCVAYVIEFQKRGLPHAHIAIALKDEWKMLSGQEIDLMISAEIPDPVKHPKLNMIVLGNNIHVCNYHANDPSSCIENGICRKGFPFDLRNDTILVDSSYPLYRRRNKHPSEIVKKGRSILITDGRVVPYNPALSLLLNCHCNIQACSQIFHFKYFFKYFTKSAEAQIFYPNDPAKTEQKKAAFIKVKNSIHDDDEINRYKIGRFIGSSDALWSIMGFELYYLSQPVLAMPIDLPDTQTVYIRDNMLIGKYERTMLSAFFEINASHGDMPLAFSPSRRVKDLLYQEMPEHFLWDSGNKMWTARARLTHNGVCQIARLQTPSTTQQEKWALWLLLRHTPGPKAYEDLLNGAPSFMAACGNRGLLINDSEYKIYMTEVIAVEMPFKCRQIFADLLCSAIVPNPWDLWEQFAQELSEDFIYEQRHLGEAVVRSCKKHALWCINNCLIIQGSSLNDFKFPLDSYCSSQLFQRINTKQTKIICQEFAAPLNEEDKQALNEEQMLFFEAVERSVLSKQTKGSKLMLLQAPGGTGKTHTLNLVIRNLLQKGMKIAVTSSTGISATALIGGQTVHSAFNAGIIVPDEGCSFAVSPSSQLAAEWSQIDVLIIDEVMCLNRRFVEAIAMTLQTNVFVDNYERLAMGPFCGITIIVTGDPRQQLPIDHGSRKETLISLCIHSSYLFQCFEQHHLIKNVRIHHSISFMHDDGSPQKLQEWILMVGDGVKQKNDLVIDEAHFVRIPQQFYCGDDIHHLTDRIYGDITSETIDGAESFFADRIVLSPLYRDVKMINNIMIQKFEKMGAAMVTLTSNDMVTGKYGDEEIANDYSASCFPEHKLTLFVGCPVMVLRKYSGQVNNGDRAVVDSIAPYRLGLRMLTGTRKGQIVHLPRVLFKPSRDDMRLEMQRLQFGVVVSFAITVSKSQSCGFKRVGIWLNDHFFAHGHLYLAMSRLQVRNDGDYSLLFASRNDMMRDYRGVHAKNVVYDEVLSAYKKS
jgi:hypothetical protein